MAVAPLGFLQEVQGTLKTVDGCDRELLETELREILAAVLQRSSEDSIQIARAVFAVVKRAMKLILSTCGSSDNDDDE